MLSRVGVLNAPSDNIPFTFNVYSDAGINDGHKMLCKSCGPFMDVKAVSFSTFPKSVQISSA